MKVDKTNYNQINSWPFFEAKRVLKRISKEDKEKKLSLFKLVMAHLVYRILELLVKF